MCKHHTHFRHTHTGDDKDKCFALSLKVIEQLFLLSLLLLQRSMENYKVLEELSVLRSSVLTNDIFLRWHFLHFNYAVKCSHKMYSSLSNGLLCPKITREPSDCIHKSPPSLNPQRQVHIFPKSHPGFLLKKKKVGGKNHKAP